MLWDTAFRFFPSFGHLFADTVENNIKFGCPDATHEQVVAAARKACCHDFISALPEGYDTVIGEGGAPLSSGEKQRISIAQCLLKDAPIVIFDEATANVDPENEDQIQKAMEAPTREMTVLMIAHRLKTVRIVDQILVLDQGRIVQKGTHDELIQQVGTTGISCPSAQSPAAGHSEHIHRTILPTETASPSTRSERRFSLLFCLLTPQQKECGMPSSAIGRSGDASIQHRKPLPYPFNGNCFLAAA